MFRLPGTPNTPARGTPQPPTAHTLRLPMRWEAPLNRRNAAAVAVVCKQRVSVLKWRRKPLQNCCLQCKSLHSDATQPHCYHSLREERMAAKSVPLHKRGGGNPHHKHADRSIAVLGPCGARWVVVRRDQVRTERVGCPETHLRTTPDGGNYFQLRQIYGRKASGATTSKQL